MNSVGNIKRYHIAKVYRRDTPQLSRGRYREFYQCDFDIAGSYPSMVPDAEVITVAVEILNSLPIGSFVVKLNHRRLLDAVFELCGVPAEKFRPICSAVDKLDKTPWSEVKVEMVEEKGLLPEVADKIEKFVMLKDEPKKLWEYLTTSKIFGDHAAANTAMQELNILFEYLEAMGCLSSILFDMSLARGLDYYTGIIYVSYVIILNHRF
jgi:histidyl-tRNA synthetase